MRMYIVFTLSSCSTMIKRHTPLFPWAAPAGSAPAPVSSTKVDYLLQLLAAVRARNGDGSTPMHPGASAAPAA